ncbi:MAG: dihydrolipoamide acetyltransferase family protein, partial [Planctomycetota bacterium]|nr:dihydrolipoamide acetyltransferase family protein [Planctomycetota bacterium]
TLEVESYYRGTLLKILAPEGVELPVGALIAVVGDPGEKIPASVLAEAGAAPAKRVAKRAAGAVPSAAAEVAAVAPVAPAVAEGGRIKVSPRARRRARELGVGLAGIRGSGPGGRIVEADVEAAARTAAAVKASPLARKLAARQGVDLAAVPGTGVRGKVMKEDVLRAAGQGAPPKSPQATRPGEAGNIVPLTLMRRVIAQRMSESKQTIPCYYLEMDADVTDLVALRTKLNAEGGPKVAFNDFVIKACGKALRLFSAVNSRWASGGVERRTEVNVGLAVALDEGLIVPVVREADKKSLRQVAAETADLAARARANRLRPDEYQDGCMTVTNLGMFGIRSFIPIVNPGESTILGLGMIEDRVVGRQGTIEIRKVMTLTLAADHRLVDGAVGAQFLETIRDALEAPGQLAE